MHSGEICFIHSLESHDLPIILHIYKGGQGNVQFEYFVKVIRPNGPRIEC